MRKFEGNINGKVYTDKAAFDKALSKLKDTDISNVSYKYVNITEVKDDLGAIKAENNKNAIECNKNYVSENQYVKNITNKKDVELDANLINKIKCATNKSEIKHNVCKKIMDFDAKIENNLLHINDLKSEYKKLDENLKIINNQIKTLDDANNNYYLHKEYYTSIKDLINKPVDIPESKEKCECHDDKCECKSNNKTDALSLKDIYNMTPYELAKYLNKRKICTLSDLVEYFLKNN